MEVFKTIKQLQARHIPAAMVTVIRTKGSVPRDTGTKMVVEISGKIHGTIGGSSVEQLVIKEAIECIKNASPKICMHDLYDEAAEDTGMICGGTMEFFIEPLIYPEKLYIFGGGHVALHLARMAGQTGFDLIIIDDRPEFASQERFPDADGLITGNPETAAEKLNLTQNDYIVILTHGHKHDYQALKGVIKKPYKYLGMIGSKKKRNDIYKRLRENDEVTDEHLQKVHCPIGLDISAETPEEIAVSILAQLIQSRRG